LRLIVQLLKICVFAFHFGTITFAKANDIYFLLLLILLGMLLKLL